jgi:hypothetical protein
LTDGPVKVPLIEVVDAAGACVAGASAAGAVVFAPALDFVAIGFGFFVAVAFVVATAALEGDDEAGALDVTPDPAIGPPAILIALVVPN